MPFLHSTLVCQMLMLGAANSACFSSSGWIPPALPFFRYFLALITSASVTILAPHSRQVSECLGRHLQSRATSQAENSSEIAVCHENYDSEYVLPLFGLRTLSPFLACDKASVEADLTSLRVISTGSK